MKINDQKENGKSQIDVHVERELTTKIGNTAIGNSKHDSGHRLTDSKRNLSICCRNLSCYEMAIRHG